MSKIDKLVEKLLLGHSDNNFDFDDLRKVILHFGFAEDIVMLQLEKEFQNIYFIKLKIKGDSENVRKKTFIS